MGRASSSKKIQRVRQAGVRRTQGERRVDGFVVVLIMIMIIGCLSVALARKSRVAAQVLEPVANQDQWHAAFGLYDCDHYLDPLPASSTPTDGIGAQDNGVISIAPTSLASAGPNARLKLFAEAAGLNLTSDSFTVSGTTYKSGQTCGSGAKKRKAEVVLFSWPPQANDKVAPTVIRGDAMANFRFAEDQDILSLALVPVGTRSIALPQGAISALANPTGSATTTTGAGG